MSSDSAKRSLKAPPRTPLAGNNASSTAAPAARLSAPKLPTTRPATSSPRLKSYDGTQAIVTPHSTMKRSKPGNAPSPDSLSAGGGSSVLSSRPRVSRPKTAASDVGSPPLVRSPGFIDSGYRATKESIDSRFFHASDVQRQAPAPKKPELKKVPTFFYADGKEDSPAPPPRQPSPVLSNVSEKRSSAPWIKPETHAIAPKSPPMLSPSLVATASSPFFASNASPYGQFRSPSPSKENIHLSYRKGASQIFGMRPTPPSTVSPTQTSIQTGESQLRQPGTGPLHQKSPSLSSIDSGNSHGSRRRSATAVEPTVSASPLTHEVKNVMASPDKMQATEFPFIDTSRIPAAVGSPPQATLSPTKNAFDIAADARRERKVLDLEISNSSLLAINASLEREVRRQKAELKRFRRLSRAGRFSMAANDSSRRLSSGLDTHDELDEAEDLDDSFGFGSANTEDLDDSSESEDGSMLSSGHLTTGTQADREQNRLAKDEKRLRVDLEKHKELLVQSQAMNQSLKRCMFATEEMIRDGRKALEYSVRVSDVKLGGRILTGHDEDDMIEIEGDMENGDEDMESAKGLLDVWRGVGRPTGSEGSGDRDSGIEVDRQSAAGGQVQPLNTSLPADDSGRPPEMSSMANGIDRSFPGLLHSPAS